ELRLPVGVRDDEDVGRALRLVGGGEIPPLGHRLLEDLEEARRDDRDDLELGALAAADGEAVLRRAGERGERGLLRLPVTEVGIRHRVRHPDGAALLRLRDRNELVGRVERQGAPQGRVGDGEDRRVGADAEGEGHHGERGEGRLLGQRADRQTKISQHSWRWLQSSRPMQPRETVRKLARAPSGYGIARSRDRDCLTNRPRRVNVRPVTAPRLSRAAAFYDVDGTLIRANIVHAFAYYALNQPTILGSLSKTVQTALSLPLFWAADKVSRKVMNELFYRYYKGQSEDRLVVLAQELFDDVIKRTIYPGATELLEESRRAGCRTVLVSGGLDFT